MPEAPLPRPPAGRFLPGPRHAAPPPSAPPPASHSRSPVDSMREAVLTVSPNRQYRGMVRPTTPATHGPAETRGWWGGGAWAGAGGWWHLGPRGVQHPIISTGSPKEILSSVP